MKFTNVKDANGAEMRYTLNTIDELEMDRRAKKWSIISSVVYLVVLVGLSIYLIL